MKEQKQTIGIRIANVLGKGLAIMFIYVCFTALVWSSIYLKEILWN